MVIVNMIYEKKYSDIDFEKNGIDTKHGRITGPGRQFDLDHYEDIINAKRSKTGFYIDNDGKKKVLFILMKKVISQDLQDVATRSFKDLAKKKNYNRGLASGKPEGSDTVRHLVDGQSMSINSSTSNIAGYYDRPDRRHKKNFKTNIACRKTAFTKNNITLWEEALPFIQKCSE